MYAVILNFETLKVDVLDVSNTPDEMYYEEYIETVLDYSLSNSQWMIIDETPTFNFIK
jgi:hypothetical protein